MQRTIVKAPSHPSRQEGVPLLPGNNFHDDPVMRQAHRKSHLLNTYQGIPTVAATLPQAYEPPMYMQCEEEVAETRLPTPLWLTQHNVLRFNAYFLEAVSESTIETMRVRRCVIYYHTEDDTILVREVPQMNSGMTQGILIKRHRIPVESTSRAPTQEYVSLQHLNVGSEVTLYGKRFHICDVDSNTRNHLEEVVGVNVPPNEGWLQDDQFEAYLAKRAFRPRANTAETSELKRHHEYGATGKINKLPSHKVAEAQKFFKNNGQVLSFLAAWDDRGSAYGDLRLLQLQYFLEDDTIQVLEPSVPNSGREDFLKMHLRQRVPRGPLEGSTKGPFGNSSLMDHLRGDGVQHLAYGVNMAAGYITADDLGIGKMVEVHGKPLLLYDCDDRTRNWYRDHLSLDMGPPIDIKDYFNVFPCRPAKERPPPHDGLGSEEDSLGNWKNLMLKPPKIDYQKMAENEGKKLQFVIRMVPSANAVIEEEMRHFLLSFWMEDDSLQIDEINFRNSGILGGKYLARQKVKRTLPNGTSRWFIADDFQIGQVITIFSKQFMVLDMDAKTRDVLDGIVEPSSAEDIKRFVVTMRDKMMSRYQCIQEAFRAAGGHMNNHVDIDELHRLLRLMNMKCQREDAKTILNMFDVNGDGVLDYNEFMAMVQGDEHSVNLDALSNSLKSVALDPWKTFPPNAAHTPDTIQQASQTSAFQQRARSLLHVLKDKVHQRRIGTAEAFRMMNGSALNSMLQPKEFRRALKEVLHLALPEDDLRTLEQTFFPGGQPCSLLRFSEILERSEDEFIARLQ